MNVDPNSVSDTNQNPSGMPVAEVQKEEKVSYETYKRVLSEKKKRDEELEKHRIELAEVKRKLKEDEELKLKEKEDYKSLIQIREKELEEARNESKALREEQLQNLKLGSFLKTLGSEVHSKYWGMIDLEQVKLDPDGKIDQMSITQAVENFKKTYPELIINGRGPKLPADAPSSGPGSLTVEEWKKLPSKEMAKRIKDLKID